MCFPHHRVNKYFFQVNVIICCKVQENEQESMVWCQFDTIPSAHDCVIEFSRALLLIMRKVDIYTEQSQITSETSS